MPKTIHRPEYRLLIQHLRDLREKLGLPQTMVAKDLGWPQQRVSQVESGVRRLDVLEFLELAGHLGLSHREAVALVERCLTEA